MRKTTRYMTLNQIPRGHSEFAAMFPPSPFHDAVDYDNTMEIVMALAGHKLSRDQDDYLLILSEMILQCDREHDQPPKRGLRPDACNT